MTGLTGRIALVTGAERGIGRAIALKLAAHGAEVLVNHPAGSSAAEEVVATISAGGGRARAVQADVSNAGQVRSMLSPYERIDILVNNAGIGVPAPLGQITEQMLDDVFAVNVKGMVFCAQEVLPRMPSGGRIVNVSSSTAQFPIPGLSVYTASKHAVRGLTEVWSRELGGRGITVNSVMPGPTSPGMADLAPPEVMEAVKRASPFGRIAAADEIAAVVAFLCSDEARWVSGQHVLVNGAATA
jgi:3-oxoacyl-[acyl-carrier protein] reductase